MRSTKCSKCGRPAFYFRAYTGERLCIKHFLESVEEKVKWNIGRNKLFSWNDKIAIAASGGKDGSVLIYLLHKIERDFPNSEIFVVTIDEGIAGHSENRVKVVRQAIKRAIEDFGGEIPLYISSFKEHYGYTLDEIVKLAEKRGIRLSPCTYCSVLRRRLLNIIAKRLGATKIATGHNLDDEAQTVYLNLGRGDIYRLIRLGAKPPHELPGFVPRVKPLRYVPEEETALYAYLKKLPSISTECPYLKYSLRGKLRMMLNRLDREHPGIKYRTVVSMDKLRPAIAESLKMDVKIRPCKKCGEPTTGEICRTCQLLEELGID